VCEHFSFFTQHRFSVDRETEATLLRLLPHDEADKRSIDHSGFFFLSINDDDECQYGFIALHCPLACLRGKWSHQRNMRFGLL
jgi:hypothetical protein